MSGFKTGNNANLYDPVTGDLVGALGLNGQEQMLVTSKIDPVTGMISLLAGSAKVGSQVDTDRVRRLAIIGDSFTAPDGVAYWTANCWWIHALSELGWPYEVVAVSAVGGRSIEGMRDAFAVEVAPYAPEIVWILGGQNNKVSIASAQSGLLALDALIQKCQAIGVSRIVCGTPCDSTTPTATTQSALFTLIQGLMVRKQDGLIEVADSWANYRDPSLTTGAMQTVLQRGDGFHPTATGARRLGYAFFSADSAYAKTSRESELVTGGSDYYVANPASNKICNNPTMVGSGGTTSGTGSVVGNVPAGWNLDVPAGVTVTLSNVIEQLPRARSWLRVVITGSMSTANSSITLMQFTPSATLGVIQGMFTRARFVVKQSGLSANFHSISGAVNHFTAGYAARGGSQVGGGPAAYAPGEMAAAKVITFESAKALVTASDLGLVQSVFSIVFGATGAVSGVVDVADFTSTKYSA